MIHGHLAFENQIIPLQKEIKQPGMYPVQVHLKELALASCFCTITSHNNQSPVCTFLTFLQDI